MYQTTSCTTTGQKEFFVRSNEEPCCPVCGGKLKKKGWVSRICRKEDGSEETYKIENRKCKNKSCRKSHRLLPDILLPYKHYEADLIEAVIDGLVGEDDPGLEDGPSESTVKRWREWGRRLAIEAEGKIRSAAYRILDLPEEFLGSRGSLLEKIKERLVQGWLPVTMRIIYNTGS